MTSRTRPGKPVYSHRRLGLPQRFAVAALATITAAVHVPVTGPHLSEAPYLALLFLALTVSCLLLAGIVLTFDPVAVYAGAAALCALAVAGYVATRLVAFPLIADDVGHWFDPLGVVAVAAETAVVIVAITMLAAHRLDRTPVS
jgi:hypothetical protein